jgi:hypothetical protein
MPDQIMVDDIVDEFTDGQLTVCAHRAAIKLNYEVELNADGSINSDKLAEAIKLHGEQEEYLAAFTEELRYMAASQITHSLVGKGLLYEDGVDENGEVRFRVVPGV